MPKQSLCLKTSKKHGQKIIALAGKLELLDKSLEIAPEQDSLCIPIDRQPKEKEYVMLKKEMPEIQLSTALFTEKQLQKENLKQVLEKMLPTNLLVMLPHALDVIGDIAIIEFPPELQSHEKVIGEAILQTHRNIKTVLAKASAVNGVFRVREYNFVAGEQKTQTIHKEFGCKYKVDLAKAYFSPRLSHEHERVSRLVQNGESVVDLFAGVGPFSILIAKKNPTVKVYAVDLNPEAVELLKVNVRVNRVEKQVIPILGNARQITSANLKGVANRVIMNLPETAIEFVDAACQAIKPDGGIIHFYAFVRSPDSIENLKYRFRQSVELASRKIEAFLYAKGVRETAPFESQIALDAKIV